jgi:hypothetical protein
MAVGGGLEPGWKYSRKEASAAVGAAGLGGMLTSSSVCGRGLGSSSFELVLASSPAAARLGCGRAFETPSTQLARFTLGTSSRYRMAGPCRVH